MLEEFKQYFFNPLCFRCGSLFVEEHLFCSHCFESVLAPRLEMKVRDIEFESGTIKHYYLIDWVPGESDLISSLIYQLKKDRTVKALRFYSKLLAKQFLLQSENLVPHNCVLALPGSSAKSVHSKILGDGLAYELKLPSREVFHKVALNTQQKHRTKAQRYELEIQTRQNQVRELITDIGCDKLNPIYVDDVLTTGSTLKASINALGLRNRGCVMTMFYRPSLGANLYGVDQTSLVVAE